MFFMRKVLITGVSQGIGRGIAERFLKEGYVLFGSFNKGREKATELIEQYGESRVKLFGPYDFTNLNNSIKFTEEVKPYQFDAVVCNAGMFSENDDFNEFDLEDFTNVMNCNFYTPLIVATALKDSIVEGGSIVIVSSNDAYPGAFSSMSYSISKSALLSLMKCLSVNYGNKGVRVNSVAPGVVDTAMNIPEQTEISPFFSPIARVGTPKDVAKVVFFLSTDEAGFISGENITIDGGYNIESVLLKSDADPDLSVLLRTYFADPSFIKIVNEYADRIGVDRNNKGQTSK